MANIDLSQPKSQLATRLKSALGRLSSFKEDAERAGQRGMLAGGAMLGGVGAGVLEGKAELNGWDLVIGEAGMSGVTLGGIVATGIGVLGGRFIGETGANFVTGVGSGVLAYSLGNAAREWAKKPPA